MGTGLMARAFGAPTFGDPCTGWLPKFAWLPTWTLEGWKWLRWVERRRIHKHQYLNGGADFWWQYR